MCAAVADPSFDLTDAAAFARWDDVTLRFSDQDSMGHVNNVSYAAYFEVARTQLLNDLQSRFPKDGFAFTLAHIAIDYRAETFYPGVLKVGGRMIGVGTKSMTSGYGIFRDGRCLATATCVNVALDTRSRTSQPILPEMRAFIIAEIAGNNDAA